MNPKNHSKVWSPPMTSGKRRGPILVSALHKFCHLLTKTLIHLQPGTPMGPTEMEVSSRKVYIYTQWLNVYQYMPTAHLQTSVDYLPSSQSTSITSLHVSGAPTRPVLRSVTTTMHKHINVCLFVNSSSVIAWRFQSEFIDIKQFSS